MTGGPDVELATPEGSAGTAATAATGSGRPARTRGRRNVTVLTVAQALFLCGTTIDLTLTALVGFRLTPTPALATLPFALISVFTTVGTPSASFVMERIGHRNGFIIGSFAAVAGGLVSVRAVSRHDFLLFCIGTACIGVYQSFCGFYRYAAAEEVLPAQRGRAIATVMGGGVAAAVAGPFIATAGIHLLSVPYAGSYLIVTLLALASAGVLCLLRLRRPLGGSDPADDPADADNRAPRRTLAIVSQPIFMAGVAGCALSFLTMMTLMTAAPVAAVSHHHTIVQGAAVVQWHLVGMYVPSFFSGRIVSRFSPTMTLYAGSALGALGSVVAIMGTGEGYFIAALALVGVGWNFMYLAGSTLLVHSYRPSERARTQATAEMITRTTATLGSLAAGALLTLLGWSMVNLLCLAPLAIAAVLTLNYRINGETPARLSPASG
ncbi:MAG TPA: MFS transporter [Mycobacteriales bacterium]|nr:MFS transporter [Mycobacteriales bacterium]